MTDSNLIAGALVLTPAKILNDFLMGKANLTECPEGRAIVNTVIRSRNPACLFEQIDNELPLGINVPATRKLFHRVLEKVIAQVA